MSATPRFLCDEMLGRLCRYLRAAGYDALLAQNGASDAELLRQCHDQGRHFLTQDQLVREHKAARGMALILPHGNLDQLAALLGEHFQLDWLSHAFTRCLMDNTPLVAADKAASARVPLDALQPDEPLRTCPACGRVYWRGSHYKRMVAKLVAWQNLRRHSGLDPESSLK
ncbi:MAG: Mut7-C RNAse domain-containing protein [Gallionellaceae bacterium]